jgi:hypothetical protein
MQLPGLGDGKTNGFLLWFGSRDMNIVSVGGMGGRVWEANYGA